MSRVQCHGSAPAMSGMQMPQGGWLSNVPCCCQPEVGSPMSPPEQQGMLGMCTVFTQYTDKCHRVYYCTALYTGHHSAHRLVSSLGEQQERLAHCRGSSCQTLDLSHFICTALCFTIQICCLLQCNELHQISIAQNWFALLVTG